MEYQSIEVLHDTNENNIRNEVTESSPSKIEVKDIAKPDPTHPRYDTNFDTANLKAQEIVSPNTSVDEDRSGEVNMEASITTDDVIRAGGFGARDDISSFLPVASDSTDFEETILDARNYEEPQGEICRPGLGWKEATKRE